MGVMGGVVGPCCFLFVVMVAAATTAGGGDPSPPLVANLPSSPVALDFVNSLCNATCSTPQDSTECSKLLAPYAASINGSNARAVRGVVAVVAAELKALDKSAVEFSKTNDAAGPCVQMIHDAAGGGKQQLAELDAAGDGKLDLAKVNEWYQDLKAKFRNCDYDITDVPKSQEVLAALAALAGVVSGGAGGPK